MTSTMFHKISLIGVGLMGGSLGMALRKCHLADYVYGIGRNPQRLQDAVDVGAIDIATTSFEEGLKDADIVVLCVPVLTTLSLVKQILPFVSPPTVLTDVGSTKLGVVKIINKQLFELSSKVEFIGSHPMCGSEKSGVDAATHCLYQGATCVLTPTAETSSQSLEKLKKMWEAVGCHTIEMSPEDHDRSVAMYSHLPHIVSSVLVNAIESLDEKWANPNNLASSGFKDTTRIAASHPQIWSDICIENRENLLEAVTQMESTLAQFHNLIEKSDSHGMYEFFNKARDVRNSKINNK